MRQRTQPGLNNAKKMKDLEGENAKLKRMPLGIEVANYDARPVTARPRMRFSELMTAPESPLKIV